MIMTLSDMQKEYPNRWLGIADVKEDDTGRLISADVIFTDKTASELALLSFEKKGVKPFFTTPDNTFYVGGVM